MNVSKSATVIRQSSNKGHEIAQSLKNRAADLWKLAGQQATAQFLDEQSKQLMLFADIFDQLCSAMVENQAPEPTETVERVSGFR